MELSIAKFFKSVNVRKMTVLSGDEIVLTFMERETGLPRFVRMTLNEARALATAIDVVVKE